MLIILRMFIIKILKISLSKVLSSIHESEIIYIFFFSFIE